MRPHHPTALMLLLSRSSSWSWVGATQMRPTTWRGWSFLQRTTKIHLKVHLRVVVKLKTTGRGRGGGSEEHKEYTGHPISPPHHRGHVEDPNPDTRGKFLATCSGGVDLPHCNPDKCHILSQTLRKATNCNTVTVNKELPTVTVMCACSH